MPTSDINRMISKYISGRRRVDQAKNISNVFKKIKIPKKTVEEIYPNLKENQMVVIKEKPSFFKRMFRKKPCVEAKMIVSEPEENEKPGEEFSETNEELEKEEKKGFFSWIFKKKKEEPVEEVREEETVQRAEAAKDIKEISRMFLAMLESLSEKEFHKFKNSENYAKFKGIIKKYT